jgi:carbon-monoxide dehydrogenase medium subunit
MKLPPFEYARPTSIAEAVALLVSHGGDAKPLAGGQSLVPMLAFRVAAPSLIVDLGKLPELRQIGISDDGVTLGAMVRWCDILIHERLRTAHPLLVAAVGHVAHYQIRNRGTVGGSIAHADPAAEMPCIAVTCEADIAVVGEPGTRVIAAAEFFQGPLLTALKPDEIITEIRLPRCFTIRTPAERRATPMSASSALLTGRCASPLRKTRSTAPRLTKKPLLLSLPRPAPPSIRRTTFTAAAPIAAAS